MVRISEFENKLRKHAEITKSVMDNPLDLKEEIKNIEGYAVGSTKVRSILKKTVTIAAAIALCVITVTITPLANPIKGFFKDIIRFDGAVTGTQYKNATNEIKVNVLDVSNKDKKTGITLEITFVNPNEMPFSLIQEVAIPGCEMIDSNNKIISSPLYRISPKGTVNDGKTLVNLEMLDVDLTSGEEYTIVIKEMRGLSKADAPLYIDGEWKCKFSVR